MALSLSWVWWFKTTSNPNTNQSLFKTVKYKYKSKSLNPAMFKLIKSDLLRFILEIEHLYLAKVIKARFKSKSRFGFAHHCSCSKFILFISRGVPNGISKNCFCQQFSMFCFSQFEEASGHLGQHSRQEFLSVSSCSKFTCVYMTQSQ